MDTTSGNDFPPAAEPSDGPRPTETDDSEGSHEGAMDKIKDVFGKFIGAEGNRHGGRDTDPGQ